MLVNAPVLLAPNFCKQFKLAVDASDDGAGGVPLQEDENGVIILFVISHIKLTNTRKYIPRLKNRVCPNSFSTIFEKSMFHPLLSL